MTHSKTPMADRMKETSANGSPIRNPSGLQFSQHILPLQSPQKRRSSNPDTKINTTQTHTASCTPSLPSCPDRTHGLGRLYAISQAIYTISEAIYTTSQAVGCCCKLRGSWDDIFRIPPRSYRRCVPSQSSQRKSESFSKSRCCQEAGARNSVDGSVRYPKCSNVGPRRKFGFNVLDPPCFLASFLWNCCMFKCITNTERWGHLLFFNIAYDLYVLQCVIWIAVVDISLLNLDSNRKLWFVRDLIVLFWSLTFLRGGVMFSF